MSQTAKKNSNSSFLFSNRGAKPQRKKDGFASAITSVAGLTFISRLLGFLRWIVQASAVGAGTVAGAYSTANQIPNVLYEIVVGGALAATIVPLLAAPLRLGEEKSVTRIANGLLGLVLLVLLPLALIVIIFAEPIASLFPISQGVDPTVQYDLITSFLRMFAIQIPLYGIGVVLTGILQTYGRFTWPALTPVASSLVVISIYGIYGYMNLSHAQEPSQVSLEILGWGTTMGVAALSLPLLLPVRNLGLRIRPTLHLNKNEIVRILRLGSAGLWTLLAQQASVVAVLALARSGGNTGTVAVYQYTQAVYVLPYAVLTVPVATVIYPRLANAFRNKKISIQQEEHTKTLVANSTSLVMVTACAGGGMLLAASYGAEVFFSLLTDVSGMGTALAFLAPGLIGYGLIYQITRVLFAADRAAGAALMSAAGWLAVIVFSIVTVHFAAPAGGDGKATLIALSVGLSAGMMCAAIGLLTVLAKNFGFSVIVPVIKVFCLAFPVALLSGLAVRQIAILLSQHGAFVVLLISVLGATLSMVLSAGAALMGQRSLLLLLRKNKISITSTV